jgi:elongation factor Ts
MPEVTVEQVRELRESTGAGIMDCKRALQDANGSLDGALAILREKGLASAAKRAGRTANQGVIESYIHSGGRIGVLVELNCETDFVARTEDFRALAHDIAMQIAAMDPDSFADEASDGGARLLEQAFIKDPSKTVQDLVTETIARTGENIQVRRFVRFALGG